MKQANDPACFLWLAVDADIIVAGGNNGLTGNPELSHRLSVLDWVKGYEPQQTNELSSLGS
jgi:hypothetical protein